VDLSNPISAVVPSLEGPVLAVLAQAGAPLSGSRVADLVPHASNPGVRAALGRLVEHGTVLAERSSHAVLYRANREHIAWPAIETAVGFAIRARHVLGERLAVLVATHLGNERAAGTTIALFGSVARGTSTPDSDVDVVLLVPDDVPEHELQRLVLDMTAGVERWTGNVCSVFELSTGRLAELVRTEDPMVRSWLDDATTISGPDLRGLLLTHGA
jgi:hypothetical protein